MAPMRILALLVLVSAVAAVSPDANATSSRKLFVRDFDGDGKADLLWTGPSTAAWLMQGASLRQAGRLSGPSDGGDVVITGDFDGDGKTDLLWRAANQETYSVVLLDGLASRSTTVLSQAGQGWEAMATGGFDHDGKMDILWKAPNGDFRVTFMNGAVIRETAAILSARPDLSVAAIADIDGNGRSDILWSAADGAVLLSTTVGAGTTATRSLIDGGSGWWPAFVGDLDGDGHADIVWRHPDGSHGVWYMANPIAPRFFGLVGANSGWSVRFVRDLDGDGTSDLVWVHDDGSYAVWLMGPSGPKSYASILGPATGWSVVAADDYDGDGSDDLLWRSADGSYAVWLMTGTRAKAYNLLFGGGTGWDSAPALEGCDRTTSGSFSISGVSGAAVTTWGSPSFIQVRRTPGSCGGAYTIHFNTQFTPTGGVVGCSDAVVAWLPQGEGTISFADGEQGIKNVAVQPGNLSGSYVLALASATPDSAGAGPTTAAGKFTATLPPTLQPCPPIAPPEFPGTATYFLPAYNNIQVVFGSTEAVSNPPLRPGETVAMIFTFEPPASGGGYVSVAPVTNFVAGPAVGLEIAVASAAGSFPGSAVGADTACSKRVPASAFADQALAELLGYNGVMPGTCPLTPGVNYAINLRQVSARYSDGDMPSCADPRGCALRVQPTSLSP